MRGLVEEVVGVGLRLGLARIQRGHPEHLPRPLAVAGGDDRGVDVIKAPLGEKAVHRVAHPAADAEHRAVEIGPRPQVGDAAKELGRVPLFLQRKVLRRLTQQADRRRLHLPRLLPALRRHQLALHRERGPGAHL